MIPASIGNVALDIGELQRVLYGNIDGYALAAQGRDRSGDHAEHTTYGDITLDCAYEMLCMANAHEGETFVDLGSGTGKAVLYAAMLFDLGRSIGIELVEELHHGSLQALERYRSDILPRLPEHKQWQDISFVHGDLRSIDFSSADIVYTHCTCFEPALMAELTRRCEQLKRGSRIITVSKGLTESPHCILRGSQQCTMAWGSATLYLYERI